MSVEKKGNKTEKNVVQRLVMMEVGFEIELIRPLVKSPYMYHTFVLEMIQSSLF